MISSRSTWWGSILAFLAALAAPLGAQRRAAVPGQLPPAAMPGEVLVCAAPGCESVLAAALAGLGMRLLERDAVSGVMRVAVPVGEESLWIGVWSTWPQVDYAEPNGVGQGGWTPDDTHFGAAWQLWNTGQLGGTPGADIEVVPAWDLTRGSSAVVVAVLDTGIDSDHREFAGRIDARGKDFVNDDDDPEADHPHGSWVSGCLGANPDNGFAVAGVDGHCRILPVKVLNRQNLGTTFDLAAGLDYVAGLPDVRVVSMSLINYPGSSTLRNALSRAHDAGKILVACAGNGGLGDADRSFPGASPLTISIGATNRNDARALFSGTGAALDFVAPGDGVVTVRHGSQADAFDVVSGCSFATPIASGIVGLLLALGDELGIALDQDAVYGLLAAGAEDQVGRPSEDTPGRDDFHGNGRLNALRSLLALGAALPLDVRPGACPNPLARNAQGVLPVALLGTASVDVHDVDVASLRLARADGVGGSVAPVLGPPGPGAVFADLGTAQPVGLLPCPATAGDGLLDLALKFSTPDVVRELELDALPGGASVALVLRGIFRDGRPLVAADGVVLVPKSTRLTLR